VIAAALPSLSPGVLLAAAVTSAAASLWLLLPRGSENTAARWLGMLLGAAALAGFIATGRRLGSLGEDAVFLTVSLVAVISGAATIVTRSPVYAAIWFAMALTGVAGVLLVLGAQFLGVATIVVYAGAILVMFLFVLMLLNVRPEEEGEPTSARLKAFGFTMVILLVAQVGGVIVDATNGPIARSFDPSTVAVARTLFESRFMSAISNNSH
jgi:NADH:ubiquinone oxidoreductase subunit 6 (subunit J)